MTDSKKHSGNISLLGGKHCLDFINTLDWRGREQPVEYLNSYQDVTRWFRYVGLIDKKLENVLNNHADKSLKKAEEALEQTIELREVLYRIFYSLAKRKKIKKKDLSLFNNYLKEIFSFASIKMNGHEFELDFGIDTNSMTGIFSPIIWEATQILTTSQRNQVKSCADEECGWLFFDTSKNQSRHWCNMKSCGNRAKARKFYQKMKKS